MNDEDIVKRLKDTAAIIPDEIYTWLHPLLIEAANEIEHLRRESSALERDQS